MLVCKPCADFQSPDAGISFKVHGLSACSHTLLHISLITLIRCVTLGACIYYMAIGWHACSGGAYMSADTLGGHIYYMAISWHACSGGAYISADTLGVRI